MQDVMLDLETMGTSPNAAIVAIGAVEFDIDRGELGREFYEIVDLQSSMDAGGVVDASTVMWWLRQSDSARMELVENGLPILEALGMFAKWLKECSGGYCRVWGNGAAFDNVILASAYRRSGLPVPWMYYNDRCYRTVQELHPDVEQKPSGTLHKAIDDAVRQAEHLMGILSPARGKNAFLADSILDQLRGLPEVG